MIKRASIFCFAFVILLVGCEHIYTTPETFGEAIFNAFKKDKFADYELQFCTAADYDRLLEITVMEDDHRAQVVARKEQDLANLRTDIQKGWDEIRSGNKLDSINWKKAEFKGTRYELTERLGIPTTDIFISFTSGEFNYEFKLDDCVRTDIRWVLTDSPRWIGKVEAGR